MSNSTRNHHHHHHSSHSEDEDESLSLSDLPLLSSTRHQQEENEEEEERLEFVHQLEGKTAPAEDFDFGSLSASLDALESEMCIADEVFYRGQILPFRHSVSSACTTATIPHSLTRSVSGSESVDRIPGSGFRSSSTASTSRSSSTRSSSINSSASADKLSQRHSNYIKNSNHHHHHNRSSNVLQNQSISSPRSPRPYAGATSTPRRSTSSAQSPIKKSALWEIFRLGLVQTPEIELEDLKFRYSKHHGNGRGSLGAVLMSGTGNGKSVIKQSSVEDLESAKQMSGKKKGGMGFMKSCKCSVEAVEPEKASVVVVGKRKQEVTRHHRTFEWLRDLSHAVVLNDV